MIRFMLHKVTAGKGTAVLGAYVVKIDVLVGLLVYRFQNRTVM
jgi:hypothetical protein